MALAPGARFGAYEIVAPIGAGGMGEVYRGRDVKLGRDAAIKILPEPFANDRERVARFEREARTLASLNHPHIAQIYGLEESGHIVGLVMELVDGEDLSQRIARGPIAFDEALTIARQIADALDAAHGQGIVHRDLKPANVKVKDDGTVKVLDFGLAKPVEGTVASGSGATITSPAMSMPGMILGTAAYMAPEQAKGRPVDKRADIWAFGCVLYEMVTGRRAFGGEDVSETIASILKTEPDWTDVPASLKPLLVSCLQKDPRKRLRDIGDVALLLEPSSATPPPQRSSSSIVAWAVAALTAAAAIAIAVAHFGERPPAMPEPVMFALAAPEGTDLADSYLSLSRDGRRLAFTARDRDGRTRIWIRDFATTTVRALPGSEGARSPFWSPDGGTLAFAVDRRLYKAGLDGGKSQVLCEIEHNAGVGSWNDDGTIVFGSRLGGPIYRVSATGGRAEPITALDLSRAETFHAIPVFLRDGRRFLYFRNSLNRSESGIYVGSIDQSPERQSTERLVSSDHGPGYFAPPAGPARVLYVSDRNVMSQELDETRPGLLGEPQLEVPQIAGAGSLAFFSVAGPGTLVYRHGVAGVPGATELTWFDRKGQALGPAADRGGYGAFTLSPDGRRVAVSMSAAGRPPDLWTIDVQRKINTRFTADGATNQFPIWSADGSQIVFRSNRAGRFDLYEKNASGLEPERLLLQTPFDKVPASSSADGRFLLFDATNPQGGTDIWLLTRGATPAANPIIASAFNELQAVFSPDGRVIAYVSDESGRPEVYVRTFTPPGQPAAAGAGQWRISNGGGTRPRWRADGKELFYRNDGLIMSVAIDSAGPRFAPASPALLFDSQSLFSNAWDVSADGQRFLLAVAPGTRSTEPITVVLNWRPGSRQP